MRHIRTRRRYRLILLSLLTLCAVLFVESRIGAFVPELKNFAEAKIEKAMGGKMRFSIGSVEGGILHPIILNDIKISGKDKSAILQSLVVDSIRTNYRVWDVFRRNRPSAAISDILEKDSRMYVNFSLKDGNITGFVGLGGDLISPKIDGYLTIFGRERVDFSGTVKDDSFDIEIRLLKGTIRAAGRISDEGVFTVDMKVNHIKLYRFDIVCDATLKNRVINTEDGSGGGSLEGELEAKNCVLNYQPFFDVKSSYRISKGVFEIPGLTIGETFKAYGRFSLKKPNVVDMTLTANNMSLSWLVLKLGAKEATSILTGTMNGKFEFKGPVKKMKIISRFDIRSGTIGPIDFDYLSACLRGEFPFLKIEDARITRSSGYFDLGGEMDLRRAGRENMFDDIKIITDDRAINWDELVSTKRQDVQEIIMRKKLSGELGIGYKKVMRGDKIDESVREDDEVGFDYKLQPNDSLKVMMKQDQGFFGFEHKDRF